MRVLTSLVLVLVAATSCTSSSEDTSHELQSSVQSAAHQHEVLSCRGQIQGPLVKGQAVHVGTNLRYPTPAPGERSQPAPAYLAEMSACPFHAPWLPPEARDDVGKVNDQGDCAFHSGIVCHYHVGPEFCPASDADCQPDLLEVHCIVPDQRGRGQPTVHGYQIACRDSFMPQPGSAWREGQACGAGLLGLFASCTQQRCCSEGTLTSVDAGGPQLHGLRPNFAICEQPLAASCRDILGAMKPHTSHAPHLGVVPH